MMMMNFVVSEKPALICTNAARSNNATVATSSMGKMNKIDVAVICAIFDFSGKPKQVEEQWGERAI